MLSAGEMYKQLRETMGMSNSYISRMTGINETKLHRFENSKTNRTLDFEELLIVCEVLEVTIEEFSYYICGGKVEPQVLFFRKIHGYFIDNNINKLEELAVLKERLSCKMK
jgi:transcriptional regulator with XRE-family HTH domain